MFVVEHGGVRGGAPRCSWRSTGVFMEEHRGVHGGPRGCSWATTGAFVVEHHGVRGRAPRCSWGSPGYSRWSTAVFMGQPAVFVVEHRGVCRGARGAREGDRGCLRETGSAYEGDRGCLRGGPVRNFVQAGDEPRQPSLMDSRGHNSIKRRSPDPPDRPSCIEEAPPLTISRSSVQDRAPSRDSKAEDGEKQTPGMDPGSPPRKGGEKRWLAK